MKAKILSIPMLFLLIACKKEPKGLPFEYNGPVEIVTETPPYRDLRDFPEVAKEKNIDSLIAGMTAGNCVYENAVGFGGAYTKEYACFERLVDLLAEKEFLTLIEHPNPIVRIYSYKALEKLNSKYLPRARTILISDTAQVCWLSGCFQTDRPVNGFVNSD